MFERKSRGAMMDDLTMLFKPSPANLAIRMADQADAAAISALVVTTLRQTHAAECRPAVIEALAAGFSLEKTSAGMARRKTLVAVMHGAIIGTAGLEVAKVQAVFVAPAWQRQGVGSALMDEIEHLASCSQCSRVALWSSLTARDFYAKRGYATLASQIHRDIATLLMRKSLVR